MRIQRLHHRVQLILLVASCLVALLAVRARWRGQEPVEQGMRLVSEGDYVPAARALARAVALAPRDARAHYYLGLAYAGLGRSEASVNHLEEAVQLRPGDSFLLIE